MIEAPLRDLVARINARPHAVTLQCCRGHFVHADQPDPENLARLPECDPGPIEYRLAYLVLAVKAGPATVDHREALRLQEVRDEVFARLEALPSIR